MGTRELFPETSWSLLRRACEQSDQAVQAQTEIAERYYRPVRDFLAVLLRDTERAQELAHDFFVKLSSQGGVLRHARAEEGAFRDYLRQALRNLARDYYRRRQAEQILVSQSGMPNEADCEVTDLPGYRAADAAFHHAWIKATLAAALARVRVLCLKRSQEMHLELFEARYLTETDRPPSWEELGARYNIDQKAARERAETVVRHFRLVLRRMLRNEVTAPGSQVTEAAIDDEIQALLSPLKE